MENVITSLLDFLGIATIPTDFPEFMYWLCSLLAGLYFMKICIVSVFSFIKTINREGMR